MPQDLQLVELKHATPAVQTTDSQDLIALIEAAIGPATNIMEEDHDDDRLREPA